MTYLLDTVTVIAILDREPKAYTTYLHARLLHKTININGICYYEIKRGYYEINISPQSEQIYSFNQLCNVCEMLLFDDVTVWDKAAELWANIPKGTPLKEHDLLIATHANFHNLIPVTKDSDFTRVKKYIGVQIEDWT
jgi:predicted nucleic acid-binding protein